MCWRSALTHAWIHRVGTQPRQAFVAVQFGHHDVHEDNVRQGVAGNPAFAVNDALGFNHVNIIFGQQSLQGEAREAGIIHNQGGFQHKKSNPHP